MGKRRPERTTTYYVECYCCRAWSNYLVAASGTDEALRLVAEYRERFGVPVADEVFIREARMMHGKVEQVG